MGRRREGERKRERDMKRGRREGGDKKREEEKCEGERKVL